ncbi:MAG: 4Fe-4S dicluster domain-containing protein [Acidobacteria bacterium]|nr:4Fe-4S dicluster domain-containing protein [Acidobacteriota bacterium]
MSVDAEPTAPPGAGQPVEKTRRVRGVVYINGLRCKGCGFCIAFCPPKVLEFSSEFNPLGYHPPHLVRPEGCTGCDLCGLYCPDFAIYAVMIKNEPEDTRPPAPPAEGAPP